MSRSLQAPTSGEDVWAPFTDQKAIADDAHVRVDLLPLPLPKLPPCNHAWARNHSRQAKSLRARSAVDRWSYLSTLSINYLFAGMHVLRKLQFRLPLLLQVLTRNRLVSVLSVLPPIFNVLLSACVVIPLLLTWFALNVS